jgi:hypothetical protein
VIGVTLLAVTALAAGPAPQVGHEVRIVQATQGPVVALLADITVESEVVGDVVAVGGGVILKPGSVVRGDIVALGGNVIGCGRVEGRVVHAGGSSLFTPDLAGATGNVTTQLGAGLLRTGLWAVVGTLVLLMLPRPVRAVAEGLPQHPVRIAVIGAISLAVWLAVAVLAVIVASTPVGAALLIVATLLLLAVKTIGIAAVALVVGRWIAPLLPLAFRGELARSSVALLGLGLLSLVPVVGEGLWIATSLVAVGATSAVLLQRWSFALPAAFPAAI